MKVCIPNWETYDPLLSYSLIQGTNPPTKAADDSSLRKPTSIKEFQRLSRAQPKLPPHPQHTLASSQFSGKLPIDKHSRKHRLGYATEEQASINLAVLHQGTFVLERGTCHPWLAGASAPGCPVWAYANSASAAHYHHGRRNGVRWTFC